MKDTDESAVVPLIILIYHRSCRYAKIKLTFVENFDLKLNTALSVGRKRTLHIVGDKNHSLRIKDKLFFACIMAQLWPNMFNLNERVKFIILIKTYSL